MAVKSLYHFMKLSCSTIDIKKINKMVEMLCSDAAYALISEHNSDLLSCSLGDIFSCSSSKMTGE